MMEESEDEEEKPRDIEPSQSIPSNENSRGHEKLTEDIEFDFKAYTQLSFETYKKIAHSHVIPFDYNCDEALITLRSK